MATSSSDTAFLTMEKSFTYRGARERWVNVYHLDQVPPSSTVWAQLAGGVWAAEQPCLPADVKWEVAYGHNPGTPPVLVYEADEPPAGEGGPAGTFVPTAQEIACPGDAAIWVRYGTTQKNKLGKPIYLRNYYHGCHWESAHDTLAGRQRNLFGTLAGAFVSGFTASGVVYHRAGPRGAVAQNHLESTYITTRTLKARGRRHRVTQQQILDYIKSHGVGDAPVLVP